MMKQADNLQFFTDQKKLRVDVEVGTIPQITFFYFARKSFEILDEEILQLISRDPSHAFLADKEEDIYSLNDGEPL